MDLLVPAPMPDICVRLWKSCPRPASHVVPRLTDRLHRDRTAILMPSTVRSSGAPPLVSDGKGYCCRPPCVPLVRLHSTAAAKATSAVLHAVLWFASIRVRLWKTAAVRQVASIATMRKSSGRKPTPPCVPLVRLHSCPTLENCRSTTGRLHRDGTAILMPSTVRSSFANHSSNICIATCTPLRVSLFANHPNRSRQIGRRRQCRRLVVTTSVVSAVSVVASVVSSVSVVVGTA